MINNKNKITCSRGVPEVPRNLGNWLTQKKTQSTLISNVFTNTIIYLLLFFTALFSIAQLKCYIKIKQSVHLLHKAVTSTGFFGHWKAVTSYLY